MSSEKPAFANSRINFRSGMIFPFQFQYFGILLIIFSILLITLNPYFSLLPLIPGLIILTGYYGLEIYPGKGEYRNFKSFLFIKTGPWIAYDGIEKIFINSSHETQKVYTRVTEGPTIRKKYYNAYLKFKNGDKVFLISRKNRISLIKKLSKLSDQLGLEITDNTE